MFGYSVAWVSCIINSDAFQARLAERRGALVDPAILENIEKRFNNLAHQSMDVIMQKLEETKSADLAMQALKLSTTAMGLGQDKKAPASVTQFIVQVPAKQASASDWVAAHAPTATIDGRTGEVS
jgi:hypothetical protein